MQLQSLMHKNPSTILRLHVPFCPRLLVECRYSPGSVVSVGYLVKSPSLGPSIKAQGVFGVQLRIAKGLTNFLLKPKVLSYSLLKNINHFSKWNVNLFNKIKAFDDFGNQSYLRMILYLFSFRWTLQWLLPTIPPAPAYAAGESPLPGSASAKSSRPHCYAAGALLCCIPTLCKICLDPYLWWVREGFACVFL